MKVRKNLENVYSLSQRTKLAFQNSSHFQHWRLSCIYFGHRSLSLSQSQSFFDMKYYFYQLAYQDSEVHNGFIELFQITPLHVGTNHHDIGFYNKRNVSATHQIAGARSSNPQITWAERGAQPPSNPPLTGNTPLKIPLILHIQGKWVAKNLFSHFYGLIPNTNYKSLECFVMLGTHSELRRGQM